MIMTLLRKPLVILIALVITIGVVYELGFAAENNTPVASVQQNLLESDFVTEGNTPVSSMPAASVQQNLTETGFVAASNTPIVSASFAPGTRWARVDESIGLRGEAYIGGARGITGADTRIYTHRFGGDGIATIPAGNNPSLPITITPNPYYTLTGVTVVAFATIEHRDGIENVNDGWGTREVVTDIRTWDDLSYSYPTSWNDSYTVPTAYFETFLRNAGTPNASQMEIEVVLYADFTYNPNPNPYFTIEFGENYLRINNEQHNWLGNTLPDGLNWTAANGGLPGSGVYNPVINRTPVSNSVGRGLWIDASHSNINGRTILVTGTSMANSTRGAWHILVEGDQTATRQSVHLILEDVKVLPGRDATAGNFWEFRWPSNTTTMIQHYASVHGNTNRIANTLINNTFGTGLGSVNVAPGSGSGGNAANRAPLILTNVDAFVTLRGDNILAHTCSSWTHPGTTAIHVDASASLVFTDASDVPDASGRRGSLYARGGGCSSAIGTMHLPVGFIQIDGGRIIAESATSSHQFAGIGHGGHSENQQTPHQGTVRDPNLRGIVINGGTIDALGFHYGIGANGGTAAGYNLAIGPTYIVITGGNVQAEASAGSGGSAIGFAFNNSYHHVRIGRPDKENSATTVTSVNWGFGAAISGNMTFYSGVTRAYSGQYAAAIGGNAISFASTAINVSSRARSAGDAESGAPLTVYGGDVTVVAGAFPQRDLTEAPAGAQFDVNQARGVSTPFPIGNNPLPDGRIIRPLYPDGFGSRVSTQDAVNLAMEANIISYGAGIGGAIRQDGGSRNNIFGGIFDITASSHGAGIGGGGSFDTNNAGRGTGINPGDGTWLGTNHVRRNVPYTNLTNRGIPEPMFFNIVSGRFGAGIGGGGSSGPLDINGLGAAGGHGGNLFIGGGNFEIHTGEYGAGIGGGGSIFGSGGDGGNVVIGGQ